MTAGCSASRPASTAALAQQRSSRTASVRTPRNARKDSRAPGTAPVRLRRLTSVSYSASSVTVSTPISASECPAIHLVAECSATSAPCASGRMPSGVASVASTTLSRPWSRAAAVSTGRSGTVSRGLVGNSSQSRPAGAELGIAQRGHGGLGVGDVDHPKPDPAERHLGVEEGALVVVEAVRQHDDRPRRQPLHQRAAGRHAGAEADRPAAFQRADGRLEGFGAVVALPSVDPGPP